MKIIVLAFFLVSLNAFSYVPTVESLFRHGSNPEVTANGVSVTFVVKKIENGPQADGRSDESLFVKTKEEDFYKIFFTKMSHDVMKVAQTRYANSTFNEASLTEKIYFPNFTSYTIKSSVEENEKGIFHGLLRSIVFNDGAFLLNYMKSLGAPVKLNSEIINRQKVNLLASYKQYLVAINKDRTAKKTAVNPLRPDEAEARDKADTIMSEPMYVDQKHVKLSRESGDVAWLVNAGQFEAVVSYKNREIQRIKYKSQLGDYEIIFKDYWLANGTHGMPRYIIVRDYKGEMYQVEILNLRHYNEKETDLINRLKKWDLLLKGKQVAEPKQPFLL
jgi:hypothetical protein